MRDAPRRTTASVKNPRATPDWFVTITMRRPARFSARIASMLHGIQLDPLGPIEIADFLDERAVAIEEDRLDASASAGVGHVACACAPRARASTVMPRMQR